jgi:hypothetical protein
MTLSVIERSKNLNKESDVTKPTSKLFVAHGRSSVRHLSARH